MAQRELIIKNTHRGLRYADGRLTDVLEAGRYELPAAARPLASAGRRSRSCWSTCASAS